MDARPPTGFLIAAQAAFPSANTPVETVGKVRFRGFTRDLFCDKSEAMFRNSLYYKELRNMGNTVKKSVFDRNSLKPINSTASLCAVPPYSIILLFNYLVHYCIYSKNIFINNFSTYIFSNEYFTPLLYNNFQKYFAPIYNRRAPWMAHGVEKCFYVYHISPQKNAVGSVAK
jgi:hypothetical protein